MLNLQQLVDEHKNDPLWVLQKTFVFARWTQYVAVVECVILLLSIVGVPFTVFPLIGFLSIHWMKRESIRVYHGWRSFCLFLSIFGFVFVPSFDSVVFASLSGVLIFGIELGSFILVDRVYSDLMCITNYNADRMRNYYDSSFQ